MKFLHTNLIARNWRKLADFYIKVFNCCELSPKRNLQGKWIEEGTGIEDVRIEGVHLSLPGYDNNGPTLEIFQYNKSIPREFKRINGQGLAHIAFRVENVEKVLSDVIDAGGGKLSEIIKQDIPGIGNLTFV